MAGSRWSAEGISVRLDGLDKVLRDAERTGIAARDLSRFTYRLGLPIADRARAMAPHRTGRLARGIRPVRSKKAVRVKVGSAARLPYAARRHWGDDGASGPMWLSRAEEALRGQTLKGFADGIGELLRTHDWS